MTGRTRLEEGVVTTELGVRVAVVHTTRRNLARRRMPRGGWWRPVFVRVVDENGTEWYGTGREGRPINLRKVTDGA
jgi:hypothetical protein